MFLRSLTTEAMGIWRLAGAFAVVKRQCESKISEANAGAKPPKCTACLDNNRDQPANEQGVSRGYFFLFVAIYCPIHLNFK